MMKIYEKPEVDYVEFMSECITNGPITGVSGEDDSSV